MTDTRKKATNGPYDLLFALGLLLVAFLVVGVWQLWVIGAIVGLAGLIYLVVWLVRSGRKS